MRLIQAIVGALLVVSPLQVEAGNSFVTVESIRFGDGSQIVASLSAGNDIQTSPDGRIEFSGQVFLGDGRISPVTVRIETDGLTSPPTVAEYADVTGRALMTGRVTFDAGVAGVPIEKTVYTFAIPEGNSTGTIIVTDEPLPGVVGWLVFAALATLTGISVYGMESCAKFTLDVGADLRNKKGEVGLECVRLQ
jgi:hypothetical protein